MKKPTNSQTRALIRAVIVCVTAFGLKLSAEQVGAIQLVAEAGLQAFYRS